MNEDMKFLRKNIKAGNIDVHPTEKALVVNYEMQATLFGEMGYSVGGDRKECQKVIRLKNLDESTNIPELAKRVIENCKLIQPSKLPEVEHLLMYLVSRKEVSGGDVKMKSSNKLADPGAFDSTEIDRVANLNDTDEYLELLYEDVKEKLEASALILQLARNPDNLEELYENSILIGALARVLKEDWKLSTDLATNIIYIFFCFSSFSNFHQIIIHFKIGVLTMNIVDHELKKYDMWITEIQKKKQEVGGNKRDKEFESTMEKFETMVRKQEQLFRVSYYMLLNIAEDVNLEVKMIGKNLIELLCKTLDRKNTDLLILVVSFIKKLSVYRENIPELTKHKVIERLNKHIPTNNLDLLSISLRVIYNLSFSTESRAAIYHCNLISKLTNLADKTDCENICICILYNMSSEDKYKKVFLKTDCIPFLMKRILDTSVGKPPLEMVSLLINLVCDIDIANTVTEGKGMKLLMKRAYKTGDYMLMKALRNVSQHDNEDIKMRFVNYISDLAELITSDSEKFDQTFRSECVGILSNLTIPDLDFEMILTEFKFVDYIKETLLIGQSQGPGSDDSLLLQVVMLVGTVANDDTCAKKIAEAGIIQILIDLITVKQEDDEIVCQIVYVFYQLIFHRSTRKIIIEKTKTPDYILDLMHDKNPEIRKVCDWTLDIISEFDEQWATKIQEEKFKWYNSQWFEMIDGGEASPSHDYDLTGGPLGPMGFDDPASAAAYLYEARGGPGGTIPFDALTADELLSRYGMLMNPGGLLDDESVGLGVEHRMTGSPNLDDDDEAYHSVYMNMLNQGVPGSMGYGSGDLPFERPENHPGFRSDTAKIEHHYPFSPGMTYGGDDDEDDDDEDNDNYLNTNYSSAARRQYHR